MTENRRKNIPDKTWSVLNNLNFGAPHNFKYISEIIFIIIKKPVVDQIKHTWMSFTFVERRLWDNK